MEIKYTTRSLVRLAAKFSRHTSKQSLRVARLDAVPPSMEKGFILSKNLIQIGRAG